MKKCWPWRHCWHIEWRLKELRSVIHTRHVPNPKFGRCMRQAKLEPYCFSIETCCQCGKTREVRPVDLRPGR